MAEKHSILAGCLLFTYGVGFAGEVLHPDEPKMMHIPEAQYPVVMPLPSPIMATGTAAGGAMVSGSAIIVPGTGILTW